jgi:hypothetical protein
MASLTADWVWISVSTAVIPAHLGSLLADQIRRVPDIASQELGAALDDGERSHHQEIASYLVGSVVAKLVGRVVRCGHAGISRARQTSTLR